MTSIAITARTLLELGQLNTRIGRRVVGTAVVDDVLGLIGFTVLLAEATGGGAAEGPVNLGEIVAFFGLAVAVRAGVIGRLSTVLARPEQPGADVLAVPKTGVGLAVLGAVLAEGIDTERAISAFVLLVPVSELVTPSLLQAALTWPWGID